MRGRRFAFERALGEFGKWWAWDLHVEMVGARMGQMGREVWVQMAFEGHF